MIFFFFSNSSYPNFCRSEYFTYLLYTKRTLACEASLACFCQTKFIHDEYLCSNFLLTNNFIQSFLYVLLSQQTFTIVNNLHTNLSVWSSVYAFFSSELYPLWTFAYEQLCLNFIQTNYFHKYFDPKQPIILW